MLGYRHAFHAGIFADVFKHALLVQIILALRKKDKPFCVFDSHAGAGFYDLESDSALKNREFAGGIGQLWGERGDGLGAEVCVYLDLVRARNPDGALRWYPGSPGLARALLRPGDGLILCERHPADYRILHDAFAGDRQVAVHHRDGYEALKALVPPPQRRGLVLMDPSYEMPGEFSRLINALAILQRRWPGAAVAIWYPIIDRESSQQFLDQLKGLGLSGILCAELGVLPYRGTVGLHGSGMVIVNAPWGIARPFERILSELRDRLKVAGPGETRLEWLVPAP